jgi:hypothetical protein
MHNNFGRSSRCFLTCKVQLFFTPQQQSASDQPVRAGVRKSVPDQRFCKRLARPGRSASP